MSEALDKAFSRFYRFAGDQVCIAPFDSYYARSSVVKLVTKKVDTDNWYAAFAGNIVDRYCLRVEIVVQTDNRGGVKFLTNHLFYALQPPLQQLHIHPGNLCSLFNTHSLGNLLIKLL